MKIKRGKVQKKTLAWYKLHWGFKQPYSVVLDASFVALCAERKVDPLKQVKKVLQATKTVKGIVANPILDEMKKLKCRDVIVLGKQTDFRVINNTGAVNLKESVGMSASAAIQALVGTDNAERYLVASQDKELRQTLYNLNCVPLIFFDDRRSIFRLSDPPASETAGTNASAIATPAAKPVDSLHMEAVREQLGLPQEKDLAEKQKQARKELRTKRKNQVQKKRQKEQNRARELALKRRSKAEIKAAKAEKQKRKTARRQERRAQARTSSTGAANEATGKRERPNTELPPAKRKKAD
eukprot:TRINITY_DN78495_c0_g1_i1.p1 TRINITY_DN78495_c0_g1~~TRINITY_DN78495_c0_g1_i1.p1  ORF type:complete len:297 (-),score=34.76 TRINITY_DN78495_c0_g1_i1:98-988(-)